MFLGRDVKRCFGLLLGLLLSLVPAVAQSARAVTKLEVVRQYQGHRLTGESLLHIHYSRDGRYLLSAASDGLAKLWTAHGDLVREFAGKPTTLLFNCRFSSDGSRIITAGYDGTARIWGIHGNILHELRGHTSGVTDAVFLKGKAGMVTSSDDGTTKFWSREGTKVSSVTRPGVTRNMEVAPDGSLVATTQDMGTISLLTPQGKSVREINTGQGRLNSVDFSADGKLILSSGFDGTARVFTTFGKPVITLRVLQNGWVTGAAFSKDKLIATVSDDGILRLWNLRGDLLDSYNPKLHRLSSVAFSPDGRDLAITAYHGTVILLKITS